MNIGNICNRKADRCDLCLGVQLLGRGRGRLLPQQPLNRSFNIRISNFAAAEKGVGNDLGAQEMGPIITLDR